MFLTLVDICWPAAAVSEGPTITGSSYCSKYFQIVSFKNGDTLINAAIDSRKAPCFQLSEMFETIICIRKALELKRKRQKNYKINQLMKEELKQ